VSGKVIEDPPLHRTNARHTELASYHLLMIAGYILSQRTGCIGSTFLIWFFRLEPLSVVPK
jgi:hypothetical protein